MRVFLFCKPQYKEMNFAMNVLQIYLEKKRNWMGKVAYTETMSWCFVVSSFTFKCCPRSYVFLQQEFACDFAKFNCVNRIHYHFLFSFPFFFCGFVTKTNHGHIRITKGRLPTWTLLSPGNTHSFSAPRFRQWLCPPLTESEGSKVNYSQSFRISGHVRHDVSAWT